MLIQATVANWKTGKYFPSEAISITQFLRRVGIVKLGFNAPWEVQFSIFTFPGIREGTITPIVFKAWDFKWPIASVIFSISQHWLNRGLNAGALCFVGMYMDRRCVYYRKPLLESGTLGTKGNVQVRTNSLSKPSLRFVYTERKRLRFYRVVTRTGKIGRHLPVREMSGNFEQTGKIRENHTKYWKGRGISDKCCCFFFQVIYYLC